MVCQELTPYLGSRKPWSPFLQSPTKFENFLASAKIPVVDPPIILSEKGWERHPHSSYPQRRESHEPIHPYFQFDSGRQSRTGVARSGGDSRLLLQWLELLSGTGDLGRGELL